MGLVLHRKKGEEIRIGEHIVVQVAELSAQRVKLYIVAPAELKIVRTELLAEPPRRRGGKGK